VALAAARTRLDDLPQAMSGVVAAIEQSSDGALKALGELVSVREGEDDIWRVYRGLRHVPASLSALYPLAGILPSVNRFFLEPGVRDDPASQQRFLLRDILDNAGVLHVGNAVGERGGFSLYVPEDYDPEVALPLVVALHGGGGDGSRFLWTWLNAARSFGAIVAAPSSIGDTWAISSEDVDTSNLEGIVSFVREEWNIDPGRILLTGMSDGGTFAWLAGLQADSPFTHLAPVSTAFHPMFLEMADADRVRGLPVFLVHGAFDWMFPVQGARQMKQALSAMGAEVTYREIEDLSHAYPREINGEILRWLAAGSR
jgi:phospholipase/carboxylesterase